MAKHSKTQILKRKEPKQTRSKELVSAILTAAIQVLENGGIRKFTSARVAEKAGVSVGSLYQYFPNKAAILFQLQVEEWEQTSAILEDILGDRQKSPENRLRLLVYSFVKSECDEASVRIALNDASPFYRDTEEAIDTKMKSKKAMEKFVIEIMLEENTEKCEFLSDMLIRVFSSFGKDFSEIPHSKSEIEQYSNALADMLLAYLHSQGAQLA